MAAPARTASSMSLTEDSRPAASGSIACGKSTVSRSGSTEITSGTPVPASFLAPSAFSSSAIVDSSFQGPLKEVHGPQVTRSRSHQRLAAAAARGIPHLAHSAHHVTREVLELMLHVQHPAPHL